MGKALNVPLHKMWGGYSDDVAAYAMGGCYRAEGDLGARGARNGGLAATRVLPAANSRWAPCRRRPNAERVRAARDGAEPGLSLMPDPNQGWHYEQALAPSRG